MLPHANFEALKATTAAALQVYLSAGKFNERPAGSSLRR